jgi:DNA-binding NarL/FixJ family response regulator
LFRLPTRVPLIVHERRDVWGRQVRPRVAELPVRLVASRSADDLLAAVAGTTSPVIVLSLGARPVEGLDLLDRALQAAPDAIAVVLDPTGEPGLARLAREIGATLVLPTETRPPVLLDLLRRWVRLAAARAAAGGWSSAHEPEPDLLDALCPAV